MLKRLVLLLISVALLLLTLPCLGEEPAEESNSLAKLSDTEVTLRVNAQKKLSLVYMKGVRMGSLKAEWSSDNEEVAMVNSKGYITGISAGQAVITCHVTSKSRGTETLSCQVTVVVPVTALHSDEKTIRVSPGQAKNIPYTVEPAEASVQVLAWTSQNEEIVTVDSSGMVTAVSAGKTRVTAKTMDGTNKILSWDVVVPSIYAEQESYTIDRPGRIQFSVFYTGDNFETGYAVDTTGSEIAYSKLLSSHQVLFTITPLAAGEAHLIITDKKDASNKADILINITNKAFYNPERLVITSAEIVDKTKVLTYKFELTNRSSEEIGEIGFLVDYRDQFGDTHYLLSNTDGSIANYQYTTMFNILPGETKTIYGQNEVFRANDMIKEVRLAVCYYRDLTGEKYYIPDSQLFWYSTKTGALPHPLVSEIYVQPDEDTMDRSMRINIGASTCNLYSYVVKDFSRSKRPGIYLASIEEGGNAASWGLQRGDVIYGADDILWADDPFVLNRAMCEVYDGKPVTLKIVRNGEEKEITLARK